MASGVGSIQIPCAFCGREVRRSPSTLARSNGRAYCDQTCRDRDRPNRKFATRSDAGIRKSPHVEKPCDTCGTIVARRVTDTRPRVFCNRACYFESVRKEGRAGRPRRREIGSKSITNEGYVVVYVGPDHPMSRSGGYCLEHRLVMSEKLGRALLPSENVHHKNGERDDNRLGNLELWVRVQPQGQRVSDLLAWAYEIIERYELVVDRLS